MLCTTDADAAVSGMAGEVGEMGEAVSSGLGAAEAMLGESVSDSEIAPATLARARSSLPSLWLRLSGEWDRLREKAEWRRMRVLRGAAAATAARAARMLLESNAPPWMPSALMLMAGASPAVCGSPPEVHVG